MLKNKTNHNSLCQCFNVYVVDLWPSAVGSLCNFPVQYSQHSVRQSHTPAHGQYSYVLCYFGTNISRTKPAQNIRFIWMWNYNTSKVHCAAHLDIRICALWKFFPFLYTFNFSTIRATVSARNLDIARAHYNGNGPV